jgi:hypothetical protein
MPAGTLDIFVKLDGIDGESTVRSHENETVCALLGAERRSPR